MNSEEANVDDGDVYSYSQYSSVNDDATFDRLLWSDSPEDDYLNHLIKNSEKAEAASKNRTKKNTSNNSNELYNMKRQTSCSSQSYSYANSDLDTDIDEESNAAKLPEAIKLMDTISVSASEKSGNQSLSSSKSKKSKKKIGNSLERIIGFGKSKSGSSSSGGSGSSRRKKKGDASSSRIRSFESDGGVVDDDNDTATYTNLYDPKTADDQTSLIAGDDHFSVNQMIDEMEREEEAHHHQLDSIRRSLSDVMNGPSTASPTSIYPANSVARSSSSGRNDSLAGDETVGNIVKNMMNNNSNNNNSSREEEESTKKSWNNFPPIAGSVATPVTNNLYYNTGTTASKIKSNSNDGNRFVNDDTSVGSSGIAKQIEVINVQKDGDVEEGGGCDGKTIPNNTTLVSSLSNDDSFLGRAQRLLGMQANTADNPAPPPPPLPSLSHPKSNDNNSKSGGGSDDGDSNNNVEGWWVKAERALSSFDLGVGSGSNKQQNGDDKNDDDEDAAGLRAVQAGAAKAAEAKEEKEILPVIEVVTTPSRYDASKDGTPSPQSSVDARSKNNQSTGTPGTPDTVIIKMGTPLGLATPDGSENGESGYNCKSVYSDYPDATDFVEVVEVDKKNNSDNASAVGGNRCKGGPWAFLKRAANDNKLYRRLVVAVVVLLIVFVVLVIVAFTRLGGGQPSTSSSSETSTATTAPNHEEEQHTTLSPLEPEFHPPILPPEDVGFDMGAGMFDNNGDIIAPPLPSPSSTSSSSSTPDDESVVGENNNNMNDEEESQPPKVVEVEPEFESEQEAEIEVEVEAEAEAEIEAEGEEIGEEIGTTTTQPPTAAPPLPESPTLFGADIVSSSVINNAIDNGNTAAPAQSPTLFGASSVSSSVINNAIDGNTDTAIVTTGDIGATISSVLTSPADDSTLEKSEGGTFVEAAEIVLLKKIEENLPETLPALKNDPNSPQYRAYEWTVNIDPPTEKELEINPMRMIQRYVLAVLYYSTDGEKSWTKSTNWLVSHDECEWYTTAPNGMCDNMGRIYDIDLRQNNLKGKFPSELVLLSNVVWFVRLNGNNLIGSLPSTLFEKMTKLERFHIHWNFMTGTLPNIPSIDGGGGLPFMISLRLGHNEFVGTVPPQLGDLSLLKRLDLGPNYLSGSIPSTIGELTDMTDLDLHDNKLNGTIPIEITKLKLLTNLELMKNDLTGVLPAGVCGGELPDLETVSVDCEEVTGCSCCSNCDRRFMRNFINDALP